MHLLSKVSDAIKFLLGLCVCSFHKPFNFPWRSLHAGEKMLHGYSQQKYWLFKSVTIFTWNKCSNACKLGDFFVVAFFWENRVLVLLYKYDIWLFLTLFSFWRTIEKGKKKFLIAWELQRKLPSYAENIKQGSSYRPDSSNGAVCRSHCRWGRAFCPWGDADKCPVFLTLHFLLLHRSHSLPLPPSVFTLFTAFPRMFYLRLQDEMGALWAIPQYAERAVVRCRPCTTSLGKQRVKDSLQSSQSHQTWATLCDISQKRRRIHRALTLVPLASSLFASAPCAAQYFTPGPVRRHGDD